MQGNFSKAYIFLKPVGVATEGFYVTKSRLTFVCRYSSITFDPTNGIGICEDTRVSSLLSLTTGVMGSLKSYTLTHQEIKRFEVKPTTRSAEPS